jgi:hypothetical protein
MKLQDVVDEKVSNFLQTRKGNGKKYTNEIIEILLTVRCNDPDGWIRAKDIRCAVDRKCRDQTLFRLLNDLTSEKIIEKRRINDNMVYYRVPTDYQDIFFLSKSELVDKLKESYDGVSNLAIKLQIAKEFLKALGVSNPDAVIDAEMKARERSWKHQFEQIKLASDQKIKKGMEDGSITQPPIITRDTDIPTNKDAGSRFL